MASLARDVMTKDVITVNPSTPLRDVARTFSDDRISGAPVVDENDRLVGIVSRTDVITGMLAAGPESVPLEMRLMLGIPETDEIESEDGGDLPEPDVPVGPTVEDVMDGDPVTVRPDASLHEIAQRMAKDRIHRVIVTEGERIVGILTSLDLLERFPGAGEAPAARRPAKPVAKAARGGVRGVAKGAKPVAKPAAKGSTKAKAAAPSRAQGKKPPRR